MTGQAINCTACNSVNTVLCMHASMSHAQRGAPAHALQILAPLTKGGNLPFRRLCADFGAEATMSEMSFARHLLRGAPQEKALLKRAANEACFGAPAGAFWRVVPCFAMGFVMVPLFKTHGSASSAWFCWYPSSLR